MLPSFFGLMTNPPEPDFLVRSQIRPQEVIEDRGGIHRPAQGTMPIKRPLTAGDTQLPGAKTRLGTPIRPAVPRSERPACGPPALSAIIPCAASWRGAPTSRTPHQVGAESEHTSQNANFNANWINRGLFDCELTTPKFGVPKVFPGGPNCGWLRKLKNSARNCMWNLPS